MTLKVTNNQYRYGRLSSDS